MEKMFLKVKNLKKIKGDIRDIISFNSAVKNQDAVIHSAAYSNDQVLNLIQNLESQ